MAFSLIVGPMKSGKSLELIARVAPYGIANQKVVYVQPKRNVRDEGISSRVGLTATSKKVDSLTEVQDSFDVIAIDEVHMFEPADIAKVNEWVKAGKEVFASGLDLDYRGTLIPVIGKLLELKPDHIIAKQSVCDVCRSYSAIYTQLLEGEKPILKGLPPVVPEDGSLVYQARCRNCFIQA